MKLYCYIYMGSNFKELVARISTVKTYLNSDMRFENCGFLNIRRCKLKTHVIIPYRHAMRSREPHLREVKKISCGDRHAHELLWMGGRRREDSFEFARCNDRIDQNRSVLRQFSSYHVGPTTCTQNSSESVQS